MKENHYQSLLKTGRHYGHAYSVTFRNHCDFYIIATSASDTEVTVTAVTAATGKPATVWTSHNCISRRLIYWHASQPVFCSGTTKELSPLILGQPCPYLVNMATSGTRHCVLVSHLNARWAQIVQLYITMFPIYVSRWGYLFLTPQGKRRILT